MQSGVTVGSTSSGTPSVDTGTFPVGSTVKLENRGNIYGRGGDGGAGGSGGAGSNGSAGGDAINLGFDITIDNTLGNIFGGGGGGKEEPEIRSEHLRRRRRGGGGQGSNAAVGGREAMARRKAARMAATEHQLHLGLAAQAAAVAAIRATAHRIRRRRLGYGGNGALAGKAIKLNSHTVTWLGNNGSQVKGSVAWAVHRLRHTYDRCRSRCG